LIQCTVGEDVDLDPGEDAKRGERLVAPGDDLQLAAQPLRR
jgi:hypothetical protein